MITKKTETISTIVTKYFKGHYEHNLNVFDEAAKLPSAGVSGMDAAYLKKLLKVFYLGQIVGLHTLNGIMSHFGIKSNNGQVKYKKLCGRLSNAALHKMYEYVFEKHLFDKLEKMCAKDGSAWSREQVTAVIDDSVFRQCLKSTDPAASYERCYGNFFSGQYGRAVPGFQAVTFGLAIGGVFYPLYFECAKKKAVKGLEGKETVSSAKKLIEKWGVFAAAAKKKGVFSPRSVSVATAATTIFPWRKPVGGKALFISAYREKTILSSCKAKKRTSPSGSRQRFCPPRRRA